MKNIYLIGFMGSGKSTLGEIVGNNMNLMQHDTDTMIEDKYGQKITEIFKVEGEKAFRAYEVDILKTIPATNCIVSTGGGIVENQANINYMKKHGIILYLQASFDEIVDRLKNDHTRPLWNNDSGKKNELYHRREKIYQDCADYIVNTDEKRPYEIAQEIKEFIK